MTRVLLIAFKLSYALFERSLFFLAALVGMQLPGWVMAYIEQLGLKTVELSHQVNGYREMAERHFNGDVQLMAQQFMQSSEEAMRHTGEKMIFAEQELIQLQELYHQMLNGGWGSRVLLLLERFDLSVAKEAFIFNGWAVDFSPVALLTALVLAVCVSLLYSLPLYLLLRHQD